MEGVRSIVAPAAQIAATSAAPRARCHSDCRTNKKETTFKRRDAGRRPKLKARHWKPSSGGGAADAHAVEGAVDEEEGDDKKGSGEDVCQSAALRGGQSHGEFDGEKAEERCEFNDRIEGDGRRVFKLIADRVADDGGVVKRRAFLFEFHFHIVL